MPEPSPPIACTLPPDRMPERLEELTALLAGHVVAIRRRPSFRRAGAELRVEIDVPALAGPVLDGLQARAEGTAGVAR